jgi:hypothetical protein
MRFLLKILLSSLILALVSEVGKRSSLAGAVLASLPLTSILALSWLYFDTADVEKVAALSMGIFWVVIPSLIFFVCLALLLRSGLRFPVAMGVSISTTAFAYAGYVWALQRMGVQF